MAQKQPDFQLHDTEAVSASELLKADEAAIQSGIDDMEQGRCQPFSAFDEAFRIRNKIGFHD